MSEDDDDYDVLSHSVSIHTPSTHSHCNCVLISHSVANGSDASRGQTFMQEN